jgi:hypothetical protein
MKTKKYQGLTQSKLSGLEDSVGSVISCVSVSSWGSVSSVSSLNVLGFCELLRFGESCM